MKVTNKQKDSNSLTFFYSNNGIIITTVMYYFETTYQVACNGIFEYNATRYCKSKDPKNGAINGVKDAIIAEAVERFPGGKIVAILAGNLSISQAEYEKATGEDKHTG